METSPGTPTRARYGVVGFAVTLALITYIDRACVAKAQPLMMKDLSITVKGMSWVYFAFAMTYGIFEIPWGWMGDRIGPRKILMRIVICWSVFTAATGRVWNLGSLITSQALFGAGEAGCFPNIAKTFTTWLPAAERVRAQGILWLSARWGGAFTPLLVTFLLNYMTWRNTFAVFAVVGVVWAIFFHRWYRDDPGQHPGVNAAERALLPKSEPVGHDAGPVPWKRFLASPSVWLLWMQYFCLAFGFIFYLTYLPTYLEEARQVKLTKGAMLAGLPLFFAGIGSLFCGFFLARLARWIGGPKRARRLLASVGMFASCGFLLLSTRIEDDVWALVVMGLAGFANDLAMPPSWGASMDLGGRYAGTLSGSMNLMSCLGAGAAHLVTGHIVTDRTDPKLWHLVFTFYAAAYFIGGVCWLFLNSVTPLDGPPEKAPEPA
jgi:MFS family permease